MARIVGDQNAVVRNEPAGRQRILTLRRAELDKRFPGLLASVLQSAQASAIGGPLVNLNGQVIGITVGGWGSGLHVVGYAIPINTVLAVATQIDRDHS